ncbi:histone H4 [Strigomonas culicis]|uniref:Histone H4 n=1 Tax=Strigomonas culicis TaxID=28005 RepID=S9W7U6_9TRYP|nr:histone H4 [Strigomonas culicis]EPY28841.1 histone H4 [Strigomonas culicis]EPY30953.1 histone H4 [Strigomonas culicis]EPY32080.1 histone H4 [Strigomonas culicis]|eukprot:EPY23518.1 histone H4 [Strigomonas culicis]
MAKGKRSADSKGAHRQAKKLLRDNVRSITKGAIRRLSRRAGVKRISGEVYEEVRRVLKSYVESVVRSSCAYAEYAHKKTISASDVVNALRKRGQILYGY